MSVIGLYLVTAIVFFGLDFLGLRFIVRPVFMRHIEPLLLDGYRAAPALVFYLFYIGGLVWFVSLPALREGAPVQALLAGALLGALAYGTYEFTNYATLKDWHPAMVATDLAWGTALTAVSAWTGVVVMRAFA